MVVTNKSKYIDNNATIDEHRIYYENRINQAGFDIPTAAIAIWQPYLEFEIEEYEDLKDELYEIQQELLLLILLLARSNY